MQNYSITRIFNEMRIFMLTIFLYSLFVYSNDLLNFAITFITNWKLNVSFICLFNIRLIIIVLFRA